MFTWLGAVEREKGGGSWRKELPTGSKKLLRVMYVHCLHCSGGFTGLLVYIYDKTHQITYIP